MKTTDLNSRDMNTPISSIRVKILLTSFILPFCMLMATWDAKAQEIENVSKYVTVYRGEENLTIKVVHCELAQSKKALIEVSGTQSPLDGVVLLHTIRGDENNTIYRMTYQGRERITLRMSKPVYGGEEFYAFLPNRQEETSLYFDNKMSAQVSAQKIVEKYQQQEKQGLQQSLIQFNRKAEEKNIEKIVQKDVDYLYERHGVKIPLEIDWATVTDKDIMDQSIQYYSNEIYYAIRNLCTDTKKKDDFKNKVTFIHLRFTDRMKIVLQSEQKILHVEVNKFDNFGECKLF